MLKKEVSLMSTTILNDDEIDLARYETAANELESGNKKTTLWHKAYAESLGDESATKAMYIKLRVEELRKEAVANAAIKMSSTEKDESSSPIDFSQPQTTKFSLYDFLQVKATATDQEVNEAIKSAEIKLSEANIEEKNKTYSQTLIKHAKEVLLDPVKRQEYTSSLYKPRTNKLPNNTSQTVKKYDVPVELSNLNLNRNIRAAVIAIFVILATFFSLLIKPISIGLGDYFSVLFFTTVESWAFGLAGHAIIWTAIREKNSKLLARVHAFYIIYISYVIALFKLLTIFIAGAYFYDKNIEGKPIMFFILLVIAFFITPLAKK